MRLLSPDDKCVQVDVRGRRYSGTTVDVSDAASVKALRAVGYVPASIAGGPSSVGGFRCPACGFASFFTRCGRCGATCARPQ